MSFIDKTKADRKWYASEFAEDDAAREVYDRKLKDIMHNHVVFASFIDESKGEAWLSELLEFIAGERGEFDERPLVDSYEEYCKVELRESGQ